MVLIYLEIIQPKRIRVGEPHALVAEKLLSKTNTNGQISKRFLVSVLSTYCRRRCRTKSGAEPKLKKIERC